MSEMLMKLCLYMHCQCIIIIFVHYVRVTVSVKVVDCNFYIHLTEISFPAKTNTCCLTIYSCTPFYLLKMKDWFLSTSAC